MRRLSASNRRNNDLVARLKCDWRSVELAAAERAMLAQAEKLTLNPSAMTRLDPESRHFTKEQVFDILITPVCLSSRIGSQMDSGSRA
jgi:hypothetical protein